MPKFAFTEIALVRVELQMDAGDVFHDARSSSEAMEAQQALEFLPWKHIFLKKWITLYKQFKTFQNTFVVEERVHFFRFLQNLECNLLELLRSGFQALGNGTAQKTLDVIFPGVTDHPQVIMRLPHVNFEERAANEFLITNPTLKKMNIKLRTKIKGSTPILSNLRLPKFRKFGAPILPNLFFARVPAFPTHILLKFLALY